MVLIVSLMAIFAMALIVPIKFANQREQETEMIHRGVQYTRAIRAYYKKFGRYPTKLDDLDSANNMRFLRRHYKDPLNKNQDFRLLHFGEPGVTLTLAGGIPGGSIPGASSIGSPTGSSSSTFGGSGLSNGPGFSGGTGGSAFNNSNSALANSSSGFGNSGVNSNGVFAQSFGNDSNSPSNQPGQPSDQASSQAQSGGTQQGSTSSGGQQIVSGGPIVGVASLCKLRTIREYNKKSKYNEWQFVYDPAADRGGLITTPYQPGLQNFGTQNLNGQSGQNGQSGSSSTSFGQSSFGQSSFGPSFGNQTPGAAIPAQPSSNSSQPQ